MADGADAAVMHDGGGAGEQPGKWRVGDVNHIGRQIARDLLGESRDDHAATIQLLTNVDRHRVKRAGLLHAAAEGENDGRRAFVEEFLQRFIRLALAGFIGDESQQLCSLWPVDLHRREPVRPEA